MSALDGITVLDFSTGAAGAIASMFLGDHGARVIRVSDPQDTAPRQGGYLVWDRGKDWISLDLDNIATALPHSQASEVYTRFIRRVDVLLEDFAPASPRQALVQEAWLTAHNPRLIHCSITAYGKHGPLKDDPPLDDLILARLGPVCRPGHCGSLAGTGKNRPRPYGRNVLNGRGSALPP
jgi:crotonobetainyl-CoA:carnitine CoA-transferase CaiB-like acyl-CoA transferase